MKLKKSLFIALAIFTGVADEKWKQFLSSDHKFGRVDETILQNTIEASLHHISFLPYSRSLSQFIDVNFQKFKFRKEHRQESFVLVAVDIGPETHFLFSFFCKLEKDLFGNFLSLRKVEGTPTVVLISPDKEKLLAFGHEAEKLYAELVETGQDGDYYYFENCGTDLEKIFQKPHVTDETMQDVTGKSISSIRVLAFVTKS